ncbi:hypothetical protein QC760_008562 [Botrytis cinerea]
MERYPTPPSTSSPQHGYHDGHNLGGARSDGPAPYGFRNDHNDQKSTIYSSFTNASTVVPASTEAWASGYPAPSANKPVDKHPQDFFGITSQDPSYNQPNPIPFGGPPPIGKSYSYDNSHVAHRPAQETYWQTTSDPSSPTQIPQTHPYPETYDPSHPSRPGPLPAAPALPSPTPSLHNQHKPLLQPPLPNLPTLCPSPTSAHPPPFLSHPRSHLLSAQKTPFSLLSLSTQTSSWFRKTRRLALHFLDPLSLFLDASTSYQDRTIILHPHFTRDWSCKDRERSETLSWKSGLEKKGKETRAQT